MALTFENLEVLFSEGVDTKTNAKLVRRGKLLRLENGVFREGGTIIKRNGYLALSRDVLGSANDILSAVSLARFNDELLLLGKNSAANPLHLFSYSSGLTKWADRGELPPVRVSNETILRNTYQQSAADCDTVNGVTVYAWADSRGGVRASVVDEATGAPLLADVLIDAAGELPRVVQALRYIWVLYIDGTNLRARRLDSVSPTAFDAEVTLAVDVKATPARFDAIRYTGNPLGSNPTNTDVLFAYSGNAVNIKVGFLLSDGTVGSGLNGRPAVISIAEGGERSISVTVAPLGDSITVFYANGTQGVRITERNADFTNKSSPLNVDAAATTATNVTAAWSANGTAQLFWETPAAATYDSFVETTAYTYGAPGSIGAVTVFKRGAGLGSKAFTKGAAPNPVFVTLLHDSTLQATYFLASQASTAVQAKMLPGLAGALNSGHLPAIVPLSSTEFFWAARVKGKFVTEANTTFSLVGVSKETMEFDTSVRSGQIGENLYFGGGIVSAYDGPSVTEAGFHLFPHDVVATPNAAGGSMATGTYGYAFIWTWIDNRGEKHRSAPHIGAAAVTGPTGRIDFTVPTLRVTDKTGLRTNVVLECFTTLVNGLVFYKTGNAAGSPTSAPVYNDPTVDTVAFQRTVADASISSNEILYTQGGIIENIAPPASRLVAVGKDRVWLSGMEDPNVIWPSKRHVAGEGVGWSDLFEIRVDPEGGDISATAFMDDKFIIFKPSAILYVAGEGPDDAGFGTFTEPILITTDVGCVNPASVAVTPDGLVFQSAKGRYLLSRGLQAVYVGAEVESSNGREDTSALLVDDQNQVRFTNSGDALVYDYFFRQWSTFTNHAAVGAAIWDGGYVYVKSDGTVMVETENYWLDAGVDIHMLLETGWVKSAGIAGFQRFRKANFLGDFKSDHTLRVRTSFDYQPFSTEEHVFDPSVALTSDAYGDDALYGDSTPYGGSADLVYQFETRLLKQKCESVKFEIVDTGSNPGQAYSLSGLTLEVGLKPGTHREPASKVVA